MVEDRKDWAELFTGAPLRFSVTVLPFADANFFSRIDAVFHILAKASYMAPSSA